MKLRKTQAIGAALLLALAATSCGTPKKVTYFQDLNQSTVIQTAFRELKVMPEDKISIVVKCKDPEISNLFNLPIYTTRTGSNTPVNGTGTAAINYVPSGGGDVASYTVSPDGTIDFPVLGKIKVAGMTRSELSGFIKGELMGRDLAKDPVVLVEFVSSGVNVLGEVEHPGRYDINRDHINVLEALALAGDLKITGVREKVHVLREENGRMNNYIIDLTNAGEMVKSPGYYLQQNDVVYVEPNEMRRRETTVNGNNALSTSFWISVASLITTAVTTIGVFVKK